MHLLLGVCAQHACVRLHLSGAKKGGGELGFLLRNKNRVLRTGLNARPGEQSSLLRPLQAAAGSSQRFPDFKAFLLDSLESPQLILFWVRILVLPYSQSHPSLYFPFLSLNCTLLAKH